MFWSFWSRAIFCRATRTPSFAKHAHGDTNNTTHRRVATAFVARYIAVDFAGGIGILLRVHPGKCLEAFKEVSGEGGRPQLERGQDGVLGSAVGVGDSQVLQTMCLGHCGEGLDWCSSCEWMRSVTNKGMKTGWNEEKQQWNEAETGLREMDVETNDEGWRTGDDLGV